jgi:hypothetical protein
MFIFARQGKVKKGKIVLVLNYHAIKMEGSASAGIAPSFFTSALHGSECSASCFGPFNPGKRDPSTHEIGDWVGPHSWSGC